MIRSRTFESDGPEGKGDDGQGQGSSIPVPTGLQTLLRLASVDPAFMTELIVRRSSIVTAVNVDLTTSERAILDAAPEDQFVQMAEMLPPPLSPRRDFLKQTAAAVVVMLAGGVEQSCDKSLDTDTTKPSSTEPKPPQPNPRAGASMTKGLGIDVPQSEETEELASPLDLQTRIPPDEVHRTRTTYGTAGIRSARLKRAENRVNIRLDLPKVQGGLNREIVRQKVSTHDIELKYCVTKEVLRTSNLKGGKVVIKCTVGPRGTLIDLSIKQSSLRNNAIEQCLLSRVRTWKFPEPRGGEVALVELPITIEIRDEAPKND